MSAKLITPPRPLTTSVASSRRPPCTSSATSPHPRPLALHCHRAHLAQAPARCLACQILLPLHLTAVDAINMASPAEATASSSTVEAASVATQTTARPAPAPSPSLRARRKSPPRGGASPATSRLHQEEAPRPATAAEDDSNKNFNDHFFFVYFFWKSRSLHDIRYDNHLFILHWVLSWVFSIL